jgi:non-ribosomal peptide synthetase component E (peptide arylation enzyme)
VRLGDGTTLTYAAVDRLARRWANALASLGLRQEERVMPLRVIGELLELLDRRWGITQEV